MNDIYQLVEKDFLEVLMHVNKQDGDTLTSAVSLYEKGIMLKDASVLNLAASKLGEPNSQWNSSLLKNVGEIPTWVVKVMAQTEILRAYNQMQIEKTDEEYVVDTYLCEDCTECLKKSEIEIPPFHPGCRCLVKGKVYVESPQEAPNNIRVQEGPKGGMFYESAGQTPEESGETEGEQPQGEQPQEQVETFIPTLLASQLSEMKDLWEVTNDEAYDTAYKGETAYALLPDGFLPPVEGLSSNRVFIKVSEESHLEFGYSSVAKILGYEMVPDVFAYEGGGHAMRWVDDAGFGGKETVMAGDYKGKVTQSMRRDFMRMTVLDWVFGNEDRHLNNFMVDPANDKLWAIDNAAPQDDYAGGITSNRDDKDSLTTMIEAGVQREFVKSFGRLEQSVVQSTIEDILDNREAIMEAVTRSYSQTLSGGQLKKALRDTSNAIEALNWQAV